MSKKVQKTLTGAMAAMMATGVVATPAMAATTNKTQADILYRAAYEATMKAESEKTQAAINEARAAIKALKEYAPKLVSAIGTFSSKVDAVQGPILRNILKLIDTAKAEPTQANINAAKEAITADLPATWRNPYSSAVDKVQVELQNKAKEAVKNAQETRKVEDIEAAKKLVAEIATSNSQAFKDWAKVRMAQLEAIKIYDLEVTNAKISNTGVSVTFKALDEAIKNATVEVVDNNGNLVEVIAKSTTLIEGETETSFTFKSKYTNDLKGIWKVNGLEVNLDHVNLIRDLKTAAVKTVNEANSQSLFTLLEKSELVDGLVDSLVAHQLYHTNIKKAYEADKVSSIKDIQDVIDVTNAEMGSDVKAYDVVKVAANGTLNQFKDILAKTGLKRINEEFYTTYKAKFATQKSNDAVTFSNLQDLIDDANDDFVEILFDGNAIDNNEGIKMLKNKDGILDASLVSKYIGYTEEYIVLDEKADDYKTQLKNKEEKVYNLKVLLAITDVISADTQTSLKAALKKYETAIGNEKNFDYETQVNENILYYLLKEVNVNSAVVNNELLNLKKNLTSTTSVDTLINKLNKLALEQSLAELSRKANTVAAKAEANVTASEKTALINALKDLEKVTVLNKDVIKGKVTETYNKFLYSYVDESLLYKIALELANENTLTVDSVVRNIEVVKAGQVSTIIKDANAETVIAKLQKIGVSNIVEANAKLYVNSQFNLTSKTTKADIQKVVNTVNAVNTINTSVVLTEVRDAVTTIGVNEGKLANYILLTNAEKLDTVELLISNRDNKGVDFTEEATIVNSIETAVNEANAKVVAILAIINNKVATATELSTQFEKISTEFAALNAAQKINVAVEFENYRPKTVVDNKVTGNAEIKSLSVVRDAINKTIKALGY